MGNYIGKRAAAWEWLANRPARGGMSSNSSTAISNMERLGGVQGMGQ